MSLVIEGKLYLNLVLRFSSGLASCINCEGSPLYATFYSSQSSDSASPKRPSTAFVAWTFQIHSTLVGTISPRCKSPFCRVVNRWHVRRRRKRKGLRRRTSEKEVPFFSILLFFFFSCCRFIRYVEKDRFSVSEKDNYVNT